MKNEYFSINSATWGEMPNALVGIGAASAAIYKKRILVVGSEAQDLSVFHLDNQQWSSLAMTDRITSLARSRTSLFLFFGEDKKAIQISDKVTTIFTG